MRRDEGREEGRKQERNYFVYGERLRREARITDGRKAGRERSMFGWI